MSASGSVPYINSRISLVAKSGVRYEGTLYAIDPKESTVALANVRSFGTEDRRPENPVPPANELYEYIIFKGSDIQDLTIMSAPAAPEPAPYPGYQQPSQFGLSPPPPFPGAPQQQGFGQFGYPGAPPYGYPPYPGGMYPPAFGGQWGAQYPPYARPPGLAPPAGSVQRGGPQPPAAPGSAAAPVPAASPSAAPAPGAPAPSAPAVPASAASTPTPTSDSASTSAPSDAPPAAATPAPAATSQTSSAPVAFAIKDKVAEAAAQSSSSAPSQPTAESKPTGAGRGSVPSKRYEVKRTPVKPGTEETQSTAAAAADSKPAQRNQAQSWAQKLAATAPTTEQSQPQSQQSHPSSRPKHDNRTQQDNRRSQRNRQDGERAGRGRGGRGGGRGGRSDVTAAELRRQMQDDFDLEKANAAFDKESLMAEIEAERAKLGQDKSEESVAYNPAVSIFDTISSEVLEKHAAAEDGNRRSREDAHKERRLNQETFGESGAAVRFNRGRGNRGRGGRGGGQQGYGVPNRSPRDNNDPNVRGRQRPQQPQRQNRPAPASKSQNQ